MRAFDRHASDVLGVPSLELMENAGAGATEGIVTLLGERLGSSPLVVVVAGGGNNGGDGFVVARRLAIAGARVKTFLALPADKLAGDALTNYRALIDTGATVT
ncbi:MAG TPA: NAD(P)H-hydrate epimerase, partial [Polyangiaceae bacterium]|nr:NAD(P)H-hydrate epimerase [Polyangiaceae bacterium]